MPPPDSTTSMQRVQDRRTYPRKQVALRVDYADTYGRASWGVARDLSGGGMFLEHTPGLSVGDTVVTTFVLPTGQPYRFKARVVRTDTKGAGLQFVNRQERYESAYIQHLDTYCVA